MGMFKQNTFLLHFGAFGFYESISSQHFSLKLKHWDIIACSVAHCINSTSKGITVLYNCKNMDNSYVLCHLLMFTPFRTHIDRYFSQSTRTVKAPTESLSSHYFYIAGIWWNLANNRAETEQTKIASWQQQVKVEGKSKAQKLSKMTVLETCQN